MKALLLRNALQSGNVASDYIRLVTENDKCAISDVQAASRPARAVLEFFDDHNKSLSLEPVVPFKSLITALTEDLREMSHLIADNDTRMDGASLYKGCRVLLRGIPERQFVIHEILWDYKEARIKEIGQDTWYLVPWDCLEVLQEQKR
jgi:hypothetical protein